MTGAFAFLTDSAVVVSFLTILRAIVDLVKSITDNKEELRRKQDKIDGLIEELRAKEALLNRKSSQIKKISEQYHKLKGGGI